MAERKSLKTAHLGTGRRKTSVARVRLIEGGSGKLTINGRSLEDYFTEDKDRNAVVGPLMLTDMANTLDVRILVHGGGITGQAGACMQGVARALKQMFGLTTPPPAPVETAEVDGAAAESAEPSFAKKLRDSGFLTRDSRMKERKKYGRKGARKSFQFSKR